MLPLALLIALAATPLPQQVASASCAAPYLDNDAGLVLERGERVVVEGRAFADGCRDTMSCSGALGCQSCEYDEPPPVPMDDVELRLVQGDRSWSLDVADARTAEDDQLGWVTWTFDVPHGAKPGPAKLRADRAQPERVTIR